MQFQISTEPGGQSFVASDEQTILEAGLASGLLLPYGCRDGACGACKAQILQGEIEQGDVSAGALTPAERSSGMALLCKARPLSDVLLKVRALARIGDIPVKKLPCRVQSLEKLTSDVMVVKLKLPASEQFRFRAGQYIDFVLEGGRRRSFSIANPPDRADHVELHVRLIEGGSFTTHVFERMKEKDILRFEGPLGSFFLREDNDRPVVLIAGGTGFAPIKSIVEHVIASARKRNIVLYWGARNREGLYMDTLVRSWTGQLDGFSYVPVLSDATASDAWQGREGLVHHAVMADFPDLSHHEVYACGAPGMIDAARSDLTIRCNLPEESFFADAFTFASDTTT